MVDELGGREGWEDCSGLVAVADKMVLMKQLWQSIFPPHKLEIHVLNQHLSLSFLLIV